MASSYAADGSALSDHCTFVRVLNEGGSGKRSGNVTIGHRHGEYSTYDKWYDGADVLLEVGLKTDNPYQRLSAVQKMLGKTSGFVTLSRVTANAGTVQADVELIGDPAPTQNRLVYLFPLRNPSGFWEDASVSTATGTAPSITTSGDRPIDDMVVTFSAPGTVIHVSAAGGTSTIEWTGTGTAIVDCGARTVLKAGANQDANLTVSQPWWLRFDAGTTENITATASVTIDWRNKWAAG